MDFVTKPFHTSELMARVRRHLTVTPVREVDRSRFLEGGGIRLDLERRRATVDGVEAVLSEREFALLAHLMRRRGSVCRQNELLDDTGGWTMTPAATWSTSACVGCGKRLTGRRSRPYVVSATASTGPEMRGAPGCSGPGSPLRGLHRPHVVVPGRGDDSLHLA